MTSYVTVTNFNDFFPLTKDNAEFTASGKVQLKLDTAEADTQAVLYSWGGIVTTAPDYPLVQRAILHLALYYLNGQQADKDEWWKWMSFIISGQTGRTRTSDAVYVEDKYFTRDPVDHTDEGGIYNIWKRQLGTDVHHD
jgi:hypothetical protein